MPDTQKILVDHAGRVYVQRRELAALKAQRAELDKRVEKAESKLAEAEQALASTLESVARRGRGRGHARDTNVDQVLTPGKLPHRILSVMKRDASRFYSAAELGSDLGIRDVQQVRTALARLVDKGLIRRTGVKGEFTL
jgi:hypothetical protein